MRDPVSRPLARRDRERAGSPNPENIVCGRSPVILREGAPPNRRERAAAPAPTEGSLSDGRQFLTPTPRSRRDGAPIRQILGSARKQWCIWTGPGGASLRMTPSAGSVSPLFLRIRYQALRGFARSRIGCSWRLGPGAPPLEGVLLNPFPHLNRPPTLRRARSVESRPKARRAARENSANSVDSVCGQFFLGIRHETCIDPFAP
jgi:hypothetical protein